MRWLVLSFALLVACGAPAKKAATMHAPVELPVVVIEDRFFLETKTASGDPLKLFLDSAGGMYLTRTAVDRLQLPTKRDGEKDTAEFPKFFDARVPRPRLEAFPVLGEDAMPGSDGMLGAPWFAERVFTFDYANKRLLLRAAGDVPQVPAPHRMAMGLPRDAAGNVESPYGRIQMQVDGESIDMLFDTGATVVLMPDAMKALGGNAVHRATSFIIASVYDKWRAAHPEWRVIEGADQTGKGAPMIEVPKLTIGGHEVGPVWFTKRPDAAFHEFMAQFMDKKADGAIGGSALKYFQRVTVDWVNAVAVFEK